MVTGQFKLNREKIFQPNLLQKLRSPLWRRTKDDTALTNPGILSCSTRSLEFENHRASILPAEGKKKDLSYFNKVCKQLLDTMNTSLQLIKITRNQRKPNQHTKETCKKSFFVAFRELSRRHFILPSLRVPVDRTPPLRTVSPGPQGLSPQYTWFCFDTSLYHHSQSTKVVKN